MVTLCHVFGVHRSSYRYWKNRPEKPDGRRAVLRSQALELHGIIHGSAGARSIATMASRRGYQMGRWLAGRLMKELGLSADSSRLPGINVVVMNMLLSLTTSVTKPNQVWCGDVAYIWTDKRWTSPFPGTGSPQTAPGGNNYSLCNGFSVPIFSDGSSCRPHALLYTPVPQRGQHFSPS